MPYLCIACELPEDRCPCDKYCALCYSEVDVRLCGDSCYYCAECREICGYTPEDRPTA